MLSIVTRDASPRLEYVCEFIFAQQFGLPYEIVQSTNNEVAISYGVELKSAINIPSVGLLYETEIKIQDTGYSQASGKHFLFAVAANDFGFDIFSAIFYLITRHEEYLPHKKDKFDRYAHEQSIAFQKGFLAEPIVDEWLHDFKMILQQLFPSLSFRAHKTQFTPTYDIDIAYSFLGKGWLRNLGGFLKTPSLQRIHVLMGKENDPYDCYDFLEHFHDRYTLTAIYFFLLAQKPGKFDKNIFVKSNWLKKLINRVAEKSKIGIHPSWQSYLDLKLIIKEKNLLSEISGRAISKSRQHYIKMQLPGTYQTLVEAGISADYSMGYGTANGFRASTANSFFWFDLSKNIATALVIHPFCFMDATSIFVDGKAAAESMEELRLLFNSCEKYGAPCTAIFHNNLLDNSAAGEERRKMYEHFLKYISQ